MRKIPPQPSGEAPAAAPESPALPPAATPEKSRVPEIGGFKGPEPTRYGDWEHNGRCTDF